MHCVADPESGSAHLQRGGGHPRSSIGVLQEFLTRWGSMRRSSSSTTDPAIVPWTSCVGSLRRTSRGIEFCRLHETLVTRPRLRPASTMPAETPWCSWTRTL